MLRFVTDEHVPTALVRGLVGREPTLDIVRCQDVGLRTGDDHGLLDWAARTGRVILSADRSTLVGFANARIAAGQPFAGLVIYYQGAASDLLIEDTLTVAHVNTPDDMTTAVVFLPL